MKLELFRNRRSTHTTGTLFVDGAFFSYTLEDPVRVIAEDGTGKVWGDTAIPEGTYKVIVNMSPRFKKKLPRLLDVPHFDGILIHSGNTTHDTHGCILVGDELTPEGTIKRGTSTPALYRLLDKLNGQSDITITIKNEA